MSRRRTPPLPLTDEPYPAAGDGLGQYWFARWRAEQQRRLDLCDKIQAVLEDAADLGAAKVWEQVAKLIERG